MVAAVPMNDNTLPPPCDLDAEAAVISACMLDPKMLALDETRSILKPSDFYSDSNRFIFTAICEVVDAGIVLDPVTVMTRLREQNLDRRCGGPAYLFQLIDATPAVLHVAEHAVIVRDKARLRRVISTFHELRVEAYGDHGAGGVQDFLVRAEARVSDIAQIATKARLRPIAEIMEEVNEQAVAAKNNEGHVVGIPTGMIDLDKKTGGLRNGNLRIIAARPAVGKSSLMLCEATNIATKGYASAIFSLEMPAVQLGFRLATMQCGIALQTLMSGIMDPRQWQDFSLAVKSISRLPLFIDETPAINLFDMRGRVKQLNAEVVANRYASVTQGRIGYVGIDYLQLMTPARKAYSRQEEISALTRDLKETAKSLDLPITVLSQLNREVEKTADKRPQLWHLREGGSQEQDADEVILLYRAACYFKDGDLADEDRDVAEANIAKQRNGPTDVVKLHFNPKLMKFGNHHSGKGYDA